MIFVIN